MSVTARRLVTLLYHDVVGPEGYASSGFPGGDAAIYKLHREEFVAHLDAVGAVTPPIAERDVAALLAPTSAAASTIFTFDDGGIGAHTHAAPLLEARRWRGHFFITTDWIARPGFMTATHLRDLHARGHLIGSHSCAHPPRMSSLPWPRIAAEWRDSVRRLEDILGAPVRSASVPAGFYAPVVAHAAEEAGLCVLFTSEPTDRARMVGGVTVLGRFSIQRGDAATRAAAFAAGRRIPRLTQAAAWNGKKVVKAVGGELWLAARRRLLQNR
ncbi:MAG TPA: polysaccharide deacetylase family protein [Gemmatirosa sp.]